MCVLVDDVGSFPLPPSTNRSLFEDAYILARKAILEGDDIMKDDFLATNFYQIIIESLKKKYDSGLDVISYPQHYDMHMQFTGAIHDAMEEGSYVVDENKAVIPEMYVIKEEARRLYEYAGDKIALRVCITGPMELYLKEIGPTAYRDVLMMFAETVRLFAKNSVLNSKYIETKVIALDEPSFGFRDVNADKETIRKILERAFEVSGVTKQIHLHSPSRIKDILNVKNIDVFSLEYAASPRNIRMVSKRDLEEADKRVRVGVSRTDIHSLTAELHDQGIYHPTREQLVESEKTIKKRFQKAKRKYGNTMTFTGPDCGLGGWPNSETAQLLLERTVSAVKSVERNSP
ncbi:MAG: hypothetical protein ACOC6H_03935 [Thermoproteota archaeon]